MDDKFEKFAEGVGVSCEEFVQCLKEVTKAAASMDDVCVVMSSETYQELLKANRWYWRLYRWFVGLFQRNE